MEEEKTLLQQIREKELEYAKKIEEVKKETDLAVESARNDAEALLCTADGTGKADAERLYWEGKGRVEADIEVLKQNAAAEREAAAVQGERNVRRAADAITGYVTME
jgi:hypothetical protein